MRAADASLRLLVIALVLGNVLLLGLRQLRPGPGPAAEPVQAEAPPGDLPTIELAADAGAQGTAECFAVGPFETEAEAEEALRFIARSAIAITRRQTTATVDRGIWVYLPVQPDFATARNMALTLRDAGFPDSDAEAQGEWKNSVSLGYFLSEANALRVYREARSLGFAVELRQQQAEEPRYWIDYEQRAGAPYARPARGGPVDPDQQRLIPCGG